MNDSTQVSHPMLKLFSVLVVWISSLAWGQIASIVATFYTSLLILDWFWKRIWKPFFINRGWITGNHSRYMESTVTQPDKLT